MFELIKSKKVICGTMMSEVFFPNVSYIFQNAGVEFFIIDCEHGSYDYSQVSSMISVARLAGIYVIVRIPEISRECITKFLDMGADGLLVPMVKNADDVRTVVNFAKYKPLGNRGISISRAHSKYNPGNLTEYMKKANERTMIFPQIELTSALDDVENIAAVEGINGIIVGPSDLSDALGIFDQLENPLLLDAVKKVAEVAEKNNLISGIITANKTLIKNCIASGMNLVCNNSELRILANGFEETIAQTKSIANEVKK